MRCRWGRPTRAARRVWSGFLPRARIVTRIVLAVVVAMTTVLALAGAVVVWRVGYALDRQVDQELGVYARAAALDVREGRAPAPGGPRLLAQVYDERGTLLSSTRGTASALLPAARVRSADDRPQLLDLGRLVPPPSSTPYRVRFQRLDTSGSPVVLVTAIDRDHRDEALRELVLQLVVAGLGAVVAAAGVGWGAARAALGPVERFRAAAEAADGTDGVQLPVDHGRDDELTRLGDTLNALLERLEAGRQRERQILADASHELRTPLALLSAEVEWARLRPRTQDEIDEVLASLGEQVGRLAALADALLRLEDARGPSGRSLDDVDVAELLGSVEQTHRATADADGRRIVVDVAPDLGPVHADRGWLEVAVGNLVANALRHGAGTVHVRALSMLGPLGARRLVLEVRDDGPGIPAELGGRAFDRFTRAETSRTAPGHGLGLAIVDAVVRRHGGETSLVPGGVRLTLPTQQEGAAGQASIRSESTS